MKLFSLCSVLAIATLSLAPATVSAEGELAFEVLKDLPYKSGVALSVYEQERCKLDLYLPAGKKAFSTLVWFHGGGLKNGAKDEVFTLPIVRRLASSGIAVAAVNYRLSPQVTYPAYVEDAAAAVSWVHAHIAEHGGDETRVYVGGHSAGATLTMLLVMDPRYLAKQGLKPEQLPGYISLSGQMLTHFTIREERKEGRFNITADESAPIHYARPDTPPLLILYADDDMATRREENEFFVSVMRAAGNAQMTAQLIKNRTHGTIASNMANADDPALKAVLDFMKVK